MKPAGNIPTWIFEEIAKRERLKKDIRVVTFLFLNGVVGLVAYFLSNQPIASIMLGGVVNYIAYRLTQSLSEEGIR